VKRLQTSLPAYRVPMDWLVIFCLALFVRILYNLTVAQGYVPQYDAGAHQSLATHLLDEHCFCLIPHIPTSGRAPLWPMLMAGIYALLGTENFYARLFLCFVGSGTCLLVYLFATHLFGRRIAIVTGVLAALYPGLYIYDGWLYSESLYTFLLLAFSYTLYLFQHTSKRAATRAPTQPYYLSPGQGATLAPTILSGIALGLLSLTRPNGFFMLGLLLIWAVIIGRAKILPWRMVAKSACIITLITLGIIAPWTIRNYTLTHTFIPVATGSGLVLVGAYNDTVLTSIDDRGMWVPPGLVHPPIVYPHHDCCSVEGEVYSYAYAANWIHSHLSAMPYLLGMHFVNMWKPSTPEGDLPVNQFPDRPASKVVWTMMQLTPIPIFLLAAFGLFVTWKRWPQFLIIYLVILLTIVECLVFYGSSRFRAPIEPMLVLLVAATIGWMSRFIAPLRGLLGPDYRWWQKNRTATGR
jgi:4-amino-4-deoxy-L-arabinose transferase-like glycosyltransferase